MTNPPPLLQLPPLSLYVHIPWCVRKCPYCDFNSHVSDAIPEQEYVAALVADLQRELPRTQGRKLASVFFGGGTPSLFSAKAIESILIAAQQHIGFSDNIEITLEANPGTVEQHKFAGYRAAGVNRLSIGVQTFQQHQLQALGRIHSRDEALNAAHAAIKAGISNFNIDLMHGLPDQTSSQACDDLRQAIDLGPTHVSWYQLTIEPNTAFFSAPPTLPEDGCLADIQDAGEHLLSTSGFIQYEVSAFSRPHQQSAHNLNYWHFGDYIGIGAGAHSKITDVRSGFIQRYWKTRMPAHYLDHQRRFVAGERVLEQQELPLEFVMNALRLNQGFSRSLFEQRTGLPIGTISDTLNRLVASALLVQRDDAYATSATGRRFLNNVLAEF